MEQESLRFDPKKKQLFLSQTETLNTFLANGAISREQYNTSFYGLITKMSITQDELDAWGASPENVTN